MNKPHYRRVFRLQRCCNTPWPPQRHGLRIIHRLDRLPALLPSGKHLLDRVEQDILVGVVVIRSTAAAGASFPAHIVAVGFRVRRPSARLALALCFLGLV